MPPNLRKAHQVLDRAVDRLYRPRRFASERERVEHLFMRYEQLRAPLPAAMQTTPGRRGRSRRRNLSRLSSVGGAGREALCRLRTRDRPW